MLKFFFKILIVFVLLNYVFGECGKISEGCNGSCQDPSYYCGPFWAGQCGCFKKNTKINYLQLLIKNNSF